MRCREDEAIALDAMKVARERMRSVALGVFQMKHCENGRTREKRKDGTDEREEKDEWESEIDHVTKVTPCATPRPALYAWDLSLVLPRVGLRTPPQLRDFRGNCANSDRPKKTLLILHNSPENWSFTAPSRLHDKVYYGP